MPISIRRVDGVEHAQVLRKLQLDVLPGDRPMRTNFGSWWIAYDGLAPVAFAGMLRSRQWLDTVYLCRAGVIKSYRGRGIQKRLVFAREAHARRMGMTWVITDTYHNPPSANNLADKGYRMFDPSNPWGARGTLYWRKKLTKDPR